MNKHQTRGKTTLFFFLFSVTLRIHLLNIIQTLDVGGSVVFNELPVFPVSLSLSLSPSLLLFFFAVLETFNCKVDKHWMFIVHYCIKNKTFVFLPSLPLTICASWSNGITVHENVQCQARLKHCNIANANDLCPFSFFWCPLIHEWLGLHSWMWFILHVLAQYVHRKHILRNTPSLSYYSYSRECNTEGERERIKSMKNNNKKNDGCDSVGCTVKAVVPD